MPVVGYAKDMQGKLIAADRSLLGMSQTELAAKAGVSRPTVTSLEHDTGNPTRASERRVIDVLEAEGVSFVETPERIGVFLSKPSSK